MRLALLTTGRQEWGIFLVGDHCNRGPRVLASTLALCPLVHLHGGEETEGPVGDVADGLVVVGVPTRRRTR